MQRDEREIDQLDADERHDEAADAVDEQVALRALRRRRPRDSSRRASASGMSAMMMSALKMTALRMALCGLMQAHDVERGERPVAAAP